MREIIEKIDRKRKGEYLTTPIRQIDLEKVHTVSDLLDAFSGASIQARALARCVDIYQQMLEDPECTIVMGMAGALIAGGLRKVIRDMIERRIVDVVVSTGAILYQDIYQARGFEHYMGDPNMDDAELRSLLLNRIYDTLVDEERFNETDHWLGVLADDMEPRGYSTREFFELIARHMDDDLSIIRTASESGVPIFCPAIADSSIGIGLIEYYEKRRGMDRFYLDTIRDNYEFTQIVLGSSCTAGIYIGGGVPKNWINDAIIMAQYLSNRPREGHSYALQITMDAPHWGGLSGSTLKEAQSWGKLSRRARKQMVFIEATVALPLLVGAVLQRGGGRGRRAPRFRWDGDTPVRET